MCSSENSFSSVFWQRYVCVHVKTIIEFDFRVIATIIKCFFCVFYLMQPSASAGNANFNLDNSRYHA